MSDMPYRTAAARVWEPVDGNRKRWLCCFLRHRRELVLSRTFPVERPQFEQPERPRAPHIKQVLAIYWISAIECRVYRCKRCGEEWMEQRTELSDEPIETTKYLVFANGATSC